MFVKVAVCSHMNVEDDPERREDRMKGREIERCVLGGGGCGGGAVCSGAYLQEQDEMVRRRRR